MSTTATGINFKQLLIDNAQSLLPMYVSDFGHLPADKLDVCPMGKARTPIDFTGECAGFNLFVASLVRGEEANGPSSEERKAFIASIDSGEKAIEALKKSVTVLAGALAEISDEDLVREVTMPWGSVSPLHQAVSMAITHMMYHLGQINYIQSLYGDDKVHWAE